MALWWALQTITTVGYGYIVPTTVVGQVFGGIEMVLGIGGIEMVLGISFITLLTAGVTTTVIQRTQRGGREADRAQLERETKRIMEALTEAKSQLSALDKRLDLIESKISE